MPAYQRYDSIKDRTTAGFKCHKCGRQHRRTFTKTAPANQPGKTTWDIQREIENDLRKQRYEYMAKRECQGDS
jgi:methionine aminopeptidase